MSPTEIVAHLDERFRLLTGGRRGRVERHQTLRAAIEWSYSLLDETERAVFDCLGVFPSNFDEAAAVDVCGSDGISRWDVIDALGGLVAKSMIGAERDGELTRYQLLETLRHFARDHADDLDGLRRAHANYYAAFAGRAGHGLATREESVWRRRLGAELDNLRAAVGWAFDAAGVDDVAIGGMIIDRLLPEAVHQPSWGIDAWAALGLARLEHLGALERASLHAAASTAAWNAGDMEQAEGFGRLAMVDAAPFTVSYMTALCWVSLSENARGDGVAVMANLADLRRRFVAEVGPQDGIARWVFHGLYSFIAVLVGDRDTAGTEVNSLLAVSRQLAVPTLLASALTTQALLVQRQPRRRARRGRGGHCDLCGRGRR